MIAEKIGYSGYMNRAPNHRVMGAFFILYEYMRVVIFLKRCDTMVKEILEEEYAKKYVIICCYIIICRIYVYVTLILNQLLLFILRYTRKRKL